MTTSTEACAHLRVSYRTQLAEQGATRGWWACDLCAVPFRPLPATPPDAGAGLLRDDESMILLREGAETVCALYCPSVWKTGTSQPHDGLCQRFQAHLAALGGEKREATA